MGKIALDTMQANEKALRVSYRRSLETDPLKNNSQRFKREAFLEKPFISPHGFGNWSR